MAALEDGEVAQVDVAAVLQRDGLVGDAGLFGLEDGVVAAGIASRSSKCACSTGPGCASCRASSSGRAGCGCRALCASAAGSGCTGCASSRGSVGPAGAEAGAGCARAGRGTSGAKAVAESLAPDEAGAGDGEVADAVAPEERVVPVVVAVVLIGVPRVLGLGGVVGPAHVAGGFAGLGRVGGDDGATLREIQIDVALQPDGEADVVPPGKEDGATTGGRGGFNGLVDGGRIDGLAVAGGAECAYVEEDWRERRGGGLFGQCGKSGKG